MKPTKHGAENGEKENHLPIHAVLGVQSTSAHLYIHIFQYCFPCWSVWLSQVRARLCKPSPKTSEKGLPPEWHFGKSINKYQCAYFARVTIHSMWPKFKSNQIYITGVISLHLHGAYICLWATRSTHNAVFNAYSLEINLTTISLASSDAWSSPRCVAMGDTSGETPEEELLDLLTCHRSES